MAKALCRPVYKLIKLLIRLLEIIVDNDLIMNAWCVGVLKLDFGLGQPLLNVFLVLGATTPEPRINARVRFHLLDALHLDIQHGYQSFCCLVCNGLFASAIVMATEKRVFHEGVLGDEGGKCRGGDEEVGYALDFAGSRLARRVGYG